jgi:hypothetical protein
MTTQTKIRIASVLLMFVTVQAFYVLAGDEIAKTCFWVLGCYAFGTYWGDLTHYVIDKYTTESTK